MFFMHKSREINNIEFNETLLDQRCITYTSTAIRYVNSMNQINLVVSRDWVSIGIHIYLP